MYPKWEYRLWTDKDNRCLPALLENPSPAPPGLAGTTVFFANLRAHNGAGGCSPSF